LSRSKSLPPDPDSLANPELIKRKIAFVAFDQTVVQRIGRATAGTIPTLGIRMTDPPVNRV
jgi:hypothetical protein